MTCGGAFTKGGLAAFGPDSLAPIRMKVQTMAHVVIAGRRYRWRFFGYLAATGGP